MRKEERNDVKIAAEIVNDRTQQKGGRKSKMFSSFLLSFLHRNKNAFFGERKCSCPPTADEKRTVRQKQKKRQKKGISPLFDRTFGTSLTSHVRIVPIFSKYLFFSKIHLCLRKGGVKQKKATMQTI